MDDYSKEIADLRREIARLIEAEAEAEEIAELEMQARVLEALYEQASLLFERGRDDPDLRRRLRMRGYGDWSLDNVYAFVFETAVDLPDVEPKAFLKGISHTDFASLLVAS
jgi:predicted translin family RNA/ssDNA-binding protein